MGARYAFVHIVKQELGSHSAASVRMCCWCCFSSATQKNNSDQGKKAKAS